MLERRRSLAGFMRSCAAFPSGASPRMAKSPDSRVARAQLAQWETSCSEGGRLDSPTIG